MAMVQVKMCPKCGCLKFFVTAHVAQRWEVDENENFLSLIKDATDIVHRPNDEDLWECADCGFEAAGKEFNIMVDEIPKKADYYVQKYNNTYRKCLMEASELGVSDVMAGADSLFNETADIEDIAGYYLFWYKESAASNLCDNIGFIRERGIEIPDKLIEVNKILKRLSH